MTEVIRVVVPGRPPNLANARLHWRKRADLVRERKEHVWAHAMVLPPAKRPTADGPRRAEATVYLSGVPMDQDNLTAALKCDLDALASPRPGATPRQAGLKACLIIDDDPQHLEVTVRQVRCKHRWEQRVEWAISKPDDRRTIE